VSGHEGGVRLGAGAEFDLIRRFLDRPMSMGPEVRVGPGDDAAVLEGGWVISTDVAVEGIHFRREWLSDEEIGFRAAAAALSDLAAMAAAPVGVLVSISAPPDRDLDLVAVSRGIRSCAESVGAAVIGGDLTASPRDLYVGLTVLGRAAWPVLRDGAEPGDHVWVTGALGASAAAVEVWEAGGAPAPALRAAYAAPTPRVREARRLVEQEVVDAMIDLSDGLAGDLGHIAAASGVRVTVETDRVPVSDAAVAVLGPERALQAALHGGEDFELAFVTDPGVVDEAYFHDRYGMRLTRVGRVEEGEGVWIETAEGDVSPAGGGFDHWRKDGG